MERLIRDLAAVKVQQDDGSFAERPGLREAYRDPTVQPCCERWSDPRRRANGGNWRRTSVAVRSHRTSCSTGAWSGGPHSRRTAIVNKFGQRIAASHVLLRVPKASEELNHIFEALLRKVQELGVDPPFGEITDEDIDNLPHSPRPGGAHTSL